MKASLATVAIALLVLGAGCGDDGGSDEPEDTAGSSAPTETTGGGPSTEDLSSYETIADLNGDLTAGGVDCQLEYEGLTDDDGNEVSQCTIDGTQAFLYIWADPADVSAVVEAHAEDTHVALAYGANWTVELNPPGASTAATATAIADAAGGTTPA